MAYLGMVAFAVMFTGVTFLARRLTIPKAVNQTIDITTLWHKVSKNINKQAKVDNDIMRQAIALQALDLRGSDEQNQQLKQDIYNEYYCGCRLLILSLLPEDASQLVDKSQHNVVQFSAHIFDKKPQH